MRIAIFGDVHGHWCAFRDAVVQLHAAHALDLVLQCGDLQPIRDEADLEYMHCPRKYRELGDFRVFREGGEVFPVPLLFVGGNHEPWSFLDQHRDGGQLVSNVEFLGRAGLKETGGLRIVGLSGNYSPEYFQRPHPEVPYPVSQRKQATYYNEQDIETALSFGHADILLLHNWPDIMNAARDDSWPPDWYHVGCEYLSMLVDGLTPHWVFCGHMHRAVRHRHRRTEIVCLSDFHREPEKAFAVIDTEAGNG
jgi:Icc-related predicted phosphoesterase